MPSQSFHALHDLYKFKKWLDEVFRIYLGSRKEKIGVDSITCCMFSSWKLINFDDMNIPLLLLFTWFNDTCKLFKMYFQVIYEGN